MQSGYKATVFGVEPNTAEFFILLCKLHSINT
uniref:Uncharacterized protein n=1 Tax=Anguilla anguilla TaxID=7936 RepID=A0A0E9PI62_ANGAN